MNVAMSRALEMTRALDAWEVALPKAAKQAIDVAKASVTIVTADPMVDLRAKVFAGTIKPGDVAAEVQAAGTARAAAREAQGIADELTAICAQRFTAAIIAGADELCAVLAEKFAHPAQALTDAARLIPAGTTAQDVLDQGPDALNAWQTLAIAAGQLDGLAAIRTGLHHQFGYGESSDVICFVAGPLTMGEVSKLRYVANGKVDSRNPLPEARGGRWQHIVDHGFTLRLNNAHEADSILHPDPVAA